MYKITQQQAPEYLQSLLPRRQNYNAHNLTNDTKIPGIFCRTEFPFNNQHLEQTSWIKPSIPNTITKPYSALTISTLLHWRQESTIPAHMAEAVV